MHVLLTTDSLNVLETTTGPSIIAVQGGHMECASVQQDCHSLQCLRLIVFKTDRLLSLCANTIRYVIA